MLAQTGQLIKSTLAGTTFAFTFMEVLDTTVANVAPPYIAGGIGVGEDEASWVVTNLSRLQRHHLNGQPLGGLKVWGIEAFGEPTVYVGEQSACFVVSAERSHI